MIDSRDVGPRRIDLNEDQQVRRWSERFGITPEQLRLAVRTVGDQALDVERHLKAAAQYG